jgi:cellulose synthase/poly-beta-1,6-N-acetylglucosamine synthase-like glycosyltransferase
MNFSQKVLDLEKETTLGPVHVSVVLPCRNETKHIRSCPESVVASDFPKDRLELLVVDGQSDDGPSENSSRV